MRLDHLLSKEHRTVLARARGLRCDLRAIVSHTARSLVEHWLLNQADRLTVLVPPHRFGGGEWERRLRGFVLVRTHCWVLRERTGGPAEAGLLSVTTSCRADLPSYRSRCTSCVGCLVVGGVGCCLLFEICIVDASIFVAKFFRAHGGCLGIRSR